MEIPSGGDGECWEGNDCRHTWTDVRQRFQDCCQSNGYADTERNQGSSVLCKQQRTNGSFWVPLSSFHLNGHTLHYPSVTITLYNLLICSAQYQHVCSPHCSPYISYGTSWENLLTHQHASSLVIIALILVTCMFGQVRILWGEIRCLSLLGLKGLNSNTRNSFCTSCSSCSVYRITWKYCSVASIWMVKLCDVFHRLKRYSQNTQRILLII